MKRIFCLLLACCLLAGILPAQFINGSLTGTIGSNTTPTGWLQVPFGDAVSMATAAFSATSDVTGTTGPLAGNINGNPFDNPTFVTGLHSQAVSATYQEGIMQTITGLTVGMAYDIRFYQNVIKQSNVVDNTGSWSVYKENTLIGISTPCTDLSPVGSNAHPWFLRTVTFTATATSHLIKFLPRDDDALISGSDGVRMGIDSITLRFASPFPMTLDFALSVQDEDAVRLDWEAQAVEGLRHFTVEHSPDGIHFEQVGEVELGHGPRYSFVDALPYSKSFYRIALVQADGGISYTEVHSIDVQAPIVALLYGRHLQLHGGNGSGTYDLVLCDMRGRTVLEQNGSDEADLTPLAPGIYFLRAISRGRENAVLEKKIWLE